MPHPEAAEQLRGGGEAAAPQPAELNVNTIRRVLTEAESQPLSGVLTYDDVASVFRVHCRTVMSWVKKGRFPPPVYYGASARFNAHQVDQVRKLGLSPAGTYTPPVSMRSRIGKIGSSVKEDKRLEAIAASKTKSKPRTPKKKGK
jgi:hypothetical protein